MNKNALALKVSLVTISTVIVSVLQDIQEWPVNNVSVLTF